MDPDDSDVLGSRRSFDGTKRNPVLYPELSHSIIGAAMQVINVLKPGLDEKHYENALVVELKKRGHFIEQQRRFDVVYEGVLVGTLVPDLLVDGLVVVDPKVVADFSETHVAQMLGYLTITQFKLAILLNFKQVHLQYKRIVR